jgi:signal recognition particle receptor subunit beta
MSYVRGSAGYFLVVDGTRADTLDVAGSIHARVTSEIGSLPFLLLLNKTDLQESWDLSRRADALESAAAGVLRTSAKTGEGVEQAFQELAKRIVR